MTTIFYQDMLPPPDVHAINAVNLNVTFSLPGGLSLQVGTLNMVSISSHREKGPVTSLGVTEPKGFTYGHRMIAGTMMFSIVDRSAFTLLLNHLQAPGGYVNRRDREMRTAVKGAFYNMKADELPPFTVNLTYANSDGLLCYESLRGVTITDMGKVTSMDLLQVQETYAFMACDWVPIQPLLLYADEQPVTPPAKKIVTQGKIKPKQSHKIRLSQPIQTVFPQGFQAVLTANRRPVVIRAGQPTGYWKILDNDGIAIVDDTHGDGFSHDWATSWSVAQNGFKLLVNVPHYFQSPYPAAGRQLTVVYAENETAPHGAIYEYYATFAVQQQ